LPDHRIKRAGPNVVTLAVIGDNNQPNLPGDYALEDPMTALLTVQSETLLAQDADEVAEFHIGLLMPVLVLSN
jgi:hypothetical protein